jgi:hypothetical protein
MRIRFHQRSGYFVAAWLEPADFLLLRDTARARSMTNSDVIRVAIRQFCPTSAKAAAGVSITEALARTPAPAGPPLPSQSLRGRSDLRRRQEQCVGLVAPGSLRET